MKKLRTVISPSILSADFANLQSQCQNVLALGADSLHIDIMDGHFVNNLTIGPPIVQSLRKKLPHADLDCHLMVTHPQSYLEPLAKATVNCFTFHYEATFPSIRQLLQKIKSHHISAGVCLKPSTDLPQQLINLVQQGLVDKVLIMTVEPGFGGQKFMPEVLPKVERLRKLFPYLDIQVDGGLNEETTKVAASHGANCIVAGSSVFNALSRKQAIEKLRRVAEQSSISFLHQ